MCYKYIYPMNISINPEDKAPTEAEGRKITETWWRVFVWEQHQHTNA